MRVHAISTIDPRHLDGGRVASPGRRRDPRRSPIPLVRRIAMLSLNHDAPLRLENRQMTFARGFLKVLALVGGAFITVVSLMALAGIYTDNGWARASIAIVIALGVPLLLVDRVLAL